MGQGIAGLDKTNLHAELGIIMVQDWTVHPDIEDLKIRRVGSTLEAQYYKLVPEGCSQTLPPMHQVTLPGSDDPLVLTHMLHEISPAPFGGHPGVVYRFTATFKIPHKDEEAGV